MNRVITILLYLCFTVHAYSQQEQRYSAVNPALFLYTKDDVYVKPLNKYKNGENIIKPDPTLYPWETYLENGMPNILRDPNGNLSIYISSWVAYSSTPPSKMGVMVYTNNTSNVENWQRPEAGLYWYNPLGATGDGKISSVYQSGFKPTNIVAVDVESFGIYDDYETTTKPVKLIYLPQRESGNKMLAGYEMDRIFTEKGILKDFEKMKVDRITNQKKFIFKFINGDTHMNYLKQNGKYYFVSRLNGKRSALKAEEHLPLTPDARKRYRRETVTEIGENLISKNVDFSIGLDMSTLQWEPYSMQPVRFQNFEKDIWWGLVTMFGTEGDAEVQYKQRTELAISNDGVNWSYLKPGVPFLDNGTDPQSDDYGCINIGKPVLNTRFSETNSQDAYYFYAASNIRHVSGRNPGISLAIGNCGKMAGLKAGQSQKTFRSMNPVDNPVMIADMPKLSLYNSFWLGGEFFPYILADVTDDPRGKSLTQLNSYATVLLYEYSPEGQSGKGAFLGGTLGSSVQGTNIVSDNYEAVGFVKNATDGNSKKFLLDYFRDYSQKHPDEVLSMKDFPEIPIVVEALVKNAVLYGVKFRQGIQAPDASLNLTAPSNYKVETIWTYTPQNVAAAQHTEDFSQMKKLPNQKLAVDKNMGTIAVKVQPVQSANKQTVFRMYGDNNNSLGVYYEPTGAFQYVLQKDGLPFASMTIAPPTGKTFAGKEVTFTIESVKNDIRKYAREKNEEAAIFRVSCPSIGFENIVQQDILWNWKHAEGNITPADSANARGFAYLASSAFVPGMDKISIGGKSSNYEDPFIGSIFRVEIANELPSGNSDFWEDNKAKAAIRKEQ